MILVRYRISCRELVLQEARTKLSWKSGKDKVIVMIGDDIPHPVGYRYGCYINKIDWMNEVGLLKEAQIKVYGVHAMSGVRKSSEYFYRALALLSGGKYLTLDQFSDITHLLNAICYTQSNDIESYIDSIQQNTNISISRSLKETFSTLSGRQFKSVGPSFAQIHPVPSGRFQKLFVDYDILISDFVRDQGIYFQTGRGFYELTKPVNISQKKEIIFMDVNSGDFYNGGEVRKILGLPPQDDRGNCTVKLRPVHLENFKVFIQSTSVNRKLIGGTYLLYEVSD